MDQKGKKYPVSSSDYKLYEEVGEGVSATVYRALCIPFNEIVAIKVLDLDKCNSSLDGIRREVQTMSLINHPNVLRAHCSFVEKHSLWVVMPYMSGGSCLHIMKSAYPDGLEEKIIATFLREVLKALEYLHSHGHIHRDVKAGNILVDASGAVKLADFGVSACMFDTGDRLRSRNTFVGTPCWMAPEVMEQLHGYDFKADIWSFGITALELAHGHAPFSKYPPMKVLLMTLQNAPPGLDYERDKKFSKSFKEMVAMCLVKDPKKRPSAEKALRHHFFKHACSKDFIARTVLDGLPPLGDRFRTLKLKELDRLAQKKMAYGEKEERSQSEYIRGISAWNFDLEDLKARAVLDDGEIPLVKTVDLEPIKGSEELMVVPSYFESPVMTHSLRVENTKGGRDHVMQVQPGTVLSPLPLQSVNGLNVGRGCVDVYEDDIIADSPTWKECIKTENSRLEATQTQQKEEAIEYIKDERHDLEKEHKLMEDIHHASVPGRKGLRGPGVLEHVLAACRGGPGDVDRHLHHQRRTESDQKFSGSSISYGTRVIDSCLEPSKSSGTPGINTYKLEDKPKESVVQQKGRFKVTSEDVDLEEAQSPSAFMHRSSFAPSCNAPSVAISTILPPLHSILQRNFTQTDQIVNLMKYVYPGKTPPAHHLSSLSSKSPSLSVAENFTPEASSSRERELLQQVADLQSRVANLVDELQTLKTKNAQLERQLNAAFNRKEERIKRG